MTDSGRDSLPAYELPKSKVSAQYYNFRHLFDMNSIIYVKLYRSTPIFLDDARFILSLMGGVLPGPAGIIVRGGQPWENSIYLNGVFLPDPAFKVFIQFPIDVDAISSIEFHRGDIPLDEQALSSVIRIHSERYVRYGKVGFPLISGMWNGGSTGVYVDLLYPLAFGKDKFVSATALVSRGPFDGFFMHNFLTYRYMADWDTLNFRRAWVRYWIGGVSIKPAEGWNFYHTTRHTFVQDEDSLVTRFWSHFGGAKFSKNERGCEVFYFQKRSDRIMGEETRPNTYRVACFYTFGKLGVRLDLMDEKLKPSARFKYKKFLSDNLAAKIYLGNAYQNFLYLAFPISEPFISKEPSMVTTFIVGFEWVKNVSLDANFYVKLYDPYTFGPLMGDNDTGMFAERRQGVDGFDFTITAPRFLISGFIQRSFWWSDVEWGLNFVLFDRNNNGAIALLMHQGFPIVIKKEAPYQYRIIREPDVFVVSIQYTAKNRGWYFTAGIYNFLQSGEHGPSALYADFVIPILSVKRYF